MRNSHIYQIKIKISDLKPGQNLIKKFNLKEHSFDVYDLNLVESDPFYERDNQIRSVQLNEAYPGYENSRLKRGRRNF